MSGAIRATIAVFTALLLACLPVEAATSIAYDPETGDWGWAYGYSALKADQVATDGCEDTSNCRIAVQCPDGAGSIAAPDSDAKGVGMVCGASSLISARQAALILCIAATQTMCWTEGSFDTRGNSQSADANGAFDRTYYLQQILYANDLDTGNTDGDFGPRTRSQLFALQDKLGMPKSDLVDGQLIYNLLPLTNGISGIAAGLSNLLPGIIDGIENHTYSFAAAERPFRTIGADMSFYPDDRQRLMLAIYLNGDGDGTFPCSIPARSAEPLDSQASVWNVRCEEGDYTLFFAEQGSSIQTGLSRLVSEDAESVSIVPLGKTKNK